MGVVAPGEKEKNQFVKIVHEHLRSPFHLSHNFISSYMIYRVQAMSFNLREWSTDYSMSHLALPTRL